MSEDVHCARATIKAARPLNSLVGALPMVRRSPIAHPSGLALTVVCFRCGRVGTSARPEQCRYSPERLCVTTVALDTHAMPY